jgi:hypothetical protein
VNHYSKLSEIVEDILVKLMQKVNILEIEDKQAISVLFNKLNANMLFVLIPSFLSPTTNHSTNLLVVA